MSAIMEEPVENVPSATSPASENELSDLDVDGDGSSSLSDIEDKDADQDENGQPLSDPSDDGHENDSEAETERLENSPEKLRKHKSVVLNSRSESQTYERSPSKLQQSALAADGEDDGENPDHTVEGDDDGEPLSDDEVSLPGSTKSLSNTGGDNDQGTVDTSLETSSGEGRSSTGRDRNGKKRKRSTAAEQGADIAGDDEEPARKRTGSVIAARDDDDAVQGEEAVESSNSASGDVSEDEAGAEAAEDDATGVDGLLDAIPQASPGKFRERKKVWRSRRGQANGASDLDQDQDASNTEQQADDNSGENGAEADEHGDDGDDDAEAILRNEEEMRRKRIAMDQLTEIEKHFTTFRERLFDERLSQLEQQEIMLKQDPPTHPEYLAMLECIIERRDGRLRTQQCLMKHQLESLERTAVSKRSQALAQYYQRVREIRERALERLGKQWYSIQHDRRGYAGGVADYTIKLPQRRQQQILHQIAYNKEVSILSGVAKHVGFPAAPPMAPITASEYEADLEKMSNRSKELSTQRAQLGLPSQTHAAFRASLSTMFNKPAEEQFIEQNPWANPQHPSHVHLIQRQASANPTSNKTSPLLQSSQPRRHSSQNGGAAPISGTFTKSSASAQSNGATPALTHSHQSQGGQLSSGSRPPSLSPQLSRTSAQVDQSESARLVVDGLASHPPRIGTFSSQNSQGNNVFDTDIPVKREQPIPATGRF